MDNPLTPNKIQRLINLAEGRPFNIERMLFSEEEARIVNQHRPPSDILGQRPSAEQESSSGIIDLDHVEGFGDSGLIANMSLSRSTAFNPGEMTGRSTGAEDPSGALSLPDHHYGRHSITVDSIANKMNKQTNEINDIMRHSIATNYSFHSKRDLTADEVSLINREAPLPVLQTTHTYFGDTMSVNSTNLSVGQYFRNRCVDFGKILGKTDSPDKMMTSITEVSASTHFEPNSNIIQVDETLDCVPVRQPKNTDNQTFRIQNKTADNANYVNIVEAQYKEASRNRAAELEKNKEIEKARELKQQETNSREQHQAKPTQSKPMNPPSQIPLKQFTSTKPTDILLKNLQSSFHPPPEDTSSATENSLSISKIADYLGKQSNISITDIMHLQKQPTKKQPLSELQMNSQYPNEVIRLIDSKKTETASSAGTINTVINNMSLNQLCLDKTGVPALVVTRATMDEEEAKRTTRSKSPSTKSPSTMTTVRDINYSNRSSGFKSNESPDSTKEDGNRSKVPSPNAIYKELDKSVDWREVLELKKIRQRAVAKVLENWVEIAADPVEGFVGVNTPVTIRVTTIADSWLTAKFEFDSLPSDGKDLNVELPRLPLLLSPGKSENFTFYITAQAEMNTTLPFTFYIKDASLDGELEQKGELNVSFQIPVLQAMSADGMNKLTYPAVLEKTSLTKTFVLISDCPSDLQLMLSITEGDSVFSIKNIQEIKKSEVNKVLLERQGSDDGGKKGKPCNKQLCRLVKDCAIRVSVTFNAPKLGDLKGDPTRMASLTGALLVTLMGINTVLKKVDLVGLVGCPFLVLKTLLRDANKIFLGHEAQEISVQNTGSVPGNWSIKAPSGLGGEGQPFAVAPNRCRLAPGEATSVQIKYIGNGDIVEMPMRFEEVSTGNVLELTLVGGNEKLKQFPIKSNASAVVSWVRAGRKEISLKNILDRKVQVRCHIAGEGFSIDMPGGEARGIYVLTFNRNECRPLPILFTPNSCMPCSAMLVISHEKYHEETRKIKLFGCASAGGEAVRWAGLVTYSDTAALVRAAPRAPVALRLHNKAAEPAFVAATVHFNLQYLQIAPYCSLRGANRVLSPRCSHTITLELDWARAETRARAARGTALATVTVLSGAEAVRRRILKILRDESNGQLELSQLPEHLRVLAGAFEGEDPGIDSLFAEFQETKACLNELISSLQELTAHIDLPQDFPEEATIILTDDTIAEHHTICQ